MPFLERDILTVSEINAMIRSLIEENYPEVAVIGEVSNFKRHTSGHFYFTLKDSSSQLSAVCFRGDAELLSFDLDDGMKVVAKGRLTLYEPYGRYQMVAYSVEMAGAGELEMAFKALCERLEKEGLFSEEHKRSLPAYPFRIAVITSPTGAAIRDIVSTLGRRWPCAEILLLPVHVQGVQAAPEIVKALELLSTLEEIDLAIVARGGGSLEDLWAFNEESVARAIFECPVPLLSAVGHETDFTIADFVADVRAATPTMAAEIAVPLIDEVEARIEEKIRRLTRYERGKIELKSARLSELLRSYGLGKARGQVERAAQSLDFALERLYRSASEFTEKRRNKLREDLSILNSLNPRTVLERGYAICSDPASGKVLSSAASALDVKEMRVTFHDGDVLAHMKEKSYGSR